MKSKRRLKDSDQHDDADIERILFIPDTHVPYHDKDQFLLALKVAKAFKPHVLVVLGDFADFYAVSQHVKNPQRRMNFAEEVIQVQDALNQLSLAARAARKIYVEGNHEYRLTRYIAGQAPELNGVTSVEEILKLRESNWEYVPYKDYVKIGNLMISHDTGSAGMNAHRRSLSDAGSGNSVVIGHTHRMSCEFKTTTDGSLVSACMFGWLGDKESIDYMHKAKVNDWVHGVGLGYHFADGTVVTQPVPFVEKGAIVGLNLIPRD